MQKKKHLHTTGCVQQKSASYKVSAVEMLGNVSRLTLGRGGKYLESLRRTFKKHPWNPV